MNFIKNPILIGTVVGILTYYLIKREADKKHKMNKKSKKRPVSLITPLVVGIIVWFLSSSYLGEGYGLNFISGDIKEIKNIDSFKTKHSLVSSDSIGTKSYHLIGKNNVRLPPTDVFIDLAQF